MYVAGECERHELLNLESITRSTIADQLKQPSHKYSSRPQYRLFTPNPSQRLVTERPMAAFVVAIPVTDHSQLG